jgi:hypothetical protein
VWLTWVQSDRTKSETKELASVIDKARHDLGRFQAERRKQRALLAARREELTRAGELPTQTPIEAYFQTLSRFASQHQLRVVRHKPLPPRTYPGLLERLFTYEVRGPMPNVLRFLKMIEEAEFWADVGYLSLDRGTGPQHASSERVAALTISLFAARPPHKEPASGGT